MQKKKKKRGLSYPFVHWVLMISMLSLVLISKEKSCKNVTESEMISTI